MNRSVKNKRLVNLNFAMSEEKSEPVCPVCGSKPFDEIREIQEAFKREREQLIKESKRRFDEEIAHVRREMEGKLENMKEKMVSFSDFYLKCFFLFKRPFVILLFKTWIPCLFWLAKRSRLDRVFTSLIY